MVTLTLENGKIESVDSNKGEVWHISQQEEGEILAKAVRHGKLYYVQSNTIKHWISLIEIDENGMPILWQIVKNVYAPLSGELKLFNPLYDDEPKILFFKSAFLKICRKYGVDIVRKIKPEKLYPAEGEIQTDGEIETFVDGSRMVHGANYVIFRDAEKSVLYKTFKPIESLDLDTSDATESTSSGEM